MLAGIIIDCLRWRFADCGDGAPNFISCQCVSISGSPSIRTIYTDTSVPETFTGRSMIHVGSVFFSLNQVYQVRAIAANRLRLDTSQGLLIFCPGTD
jgi:hypothetical protein